MYADAEDSESSSEEDVEFFYNKRVTVTRGTTSTPSKTPANLSPAGAVLVSRKSPTLSPIARKSPNNANSPKRVKSPSNVKRVSANRRHSPRKPGSDGPGSPNK